MRVCRGCWLDNVISNRTLMQEYEIDLLKPRQGSEAPLYTLFRRRVFYLLSFVPPTAREKLTQDLADFPAGRGTISIFLFWKPHLSRIVDLPARRAEANAKRAAREALGSVFRRAYVASLRKQFAGRQQSVQIQLVFALRHNEISRRRGSREFVDHLESYVHAGHKHSLIEFADKMPEPWQSNAQPIS